MFTFDEIANMLDDIADEIPKEFYKHLNGGINLSPSAKTHDAARNDDLYILGEYHHNNMGRYIVIYYGSIIKMYPRYDETQMRRRLKKLVIHEFTHHIESLAGEQSLEDKDRIWLEEYKKRLDE